MGAQPFTKFVVKPSGRSGYLSDIKSAGTFLLLFMMPVVLAAMGGSLMTMLSLHTLKQKNSIRYDGEKETMRVLLGVAELGEQMAAGHQLATSALQGAISGELQAPDLYRIHSRFIDVMAELGKRTKALSGEALVARSVSVDAASINRNFENYRNLIMMATDIAVVDPTTAENYIKKAHKAFVDFSRHRNIIAAKLQQNAIDLSVARNLAFKEVFERVVLISTLGLLAMVLVSFVSGLLLSRWLASVAGALNLLRQRTGPPQSLPEMERMEKTGIGEFKTMASAVLVFRNTIKEHHKAKRELQLHHARLEDQVRKRTDELLKANEDLTAANRSAEKANRTKSEFLANMSHELRTPLNAIIGFSEMLQQRHFGPLNEKQASYVNDVIDSGKHLLSLINDILDLSKVEAGKMELDLAAVNIKTLLEGSLIMIKESCQKKGILLNLEVPAVLTDFEFMVDDRKVKQALFNLLSNAIKFTPNGGKISITAELAGSEEIETGDGASIAPESGAGDRPLSMLITVADTGIGISPENQKKVFDEFYQVRAGWSDNIPGTGLGLPLTKKLIAIHGGRIWAESEGDARGSRFKFMLPLISNPQPPDPHVV